MILSYLLKLKGIGMNIKYRAKIIILAVFLILLLPALALSDIIYLEDGSVIKGEIISVTEETIIIKTDMGVLEIDKDKITKIEFEDKTGNEEAKLRKEIKDALKGIIEDDDIVIIIIKKGSDETDDNGNDEDDEDLIEVHNEGNEDENDGVNNNEDYHRENDDENNNEDYENNDEENYYWENDNNENNSGSYVEEEVMFSLGYLYYFDYFKIPINYSSSGTQLEGVSLRLTTMDSWLGFSINVGISDIIIPISVLTTLKMPDWGLTPFVSAGFTYNIITVISNDIYNYIDPYFYDLPLLYGLELFMFGNFLSIQAYARQSILDLIYYPNSNYAYIKWGITLYFNF